MFTQEEFQATVTAFSTPINPLADNAEGYGRTLKSVLHKMQMMMRQSQPPTTAPQSIEIEGEEERL